MLDTKIAVGGNSFNYNINAVSGTLRKSHPKSKMIIRRLNIESPIFNENKPNVFYNGTGHNIVVLQVMLIGDNRAIVEYVEEKDFVEGDYVV